MFFRRLALRVVSSLTFLPVSCALATIPAAHLFSLASTRDLAAGEAAHDGEVGIPLVEKAMPGAAVVFAAPRVPEALARWPGLTPRLPVRGGTPFEDDRIEWRVNADDGTTQLVEVRRIARRATRIVRYRATDAGVALLTSRVFTRAHAFGGFAIGLPFALAVTALARREKRRLPDLPPPRRPGVA